MTEHGPETHVARLRDEFPVCLNYVYLNHAGVSPMPRSAAEAMAAHGDDVCRHGVVHVAEWVKTVNAVRERAARMVGGTPEEIAIVKNTGEGVSLAANGLPLHDGDTIVMPAGEFPTNYRPWKHQEERGARLVVVEGRAGTPTVDELIAACRAHRARVLTLSWVGFHTGHRYDIDTLGAYCREAGIFFFLDAIQGLGALALDVRQAGVSALAADAHKWLLGPEGVGILFVDRAWQDRIAPVELGWRNVKDPLDFFTLNQPLADTARRYECGTLAMAGVYGLNAALALLLECGIVRIEARVLFAARRLADAARQKGHQPVEEPATAPQSGIVTFRPRTEDAAAALAQRLKAARVVGTFRNGWTRLAPHAYNSNEELERVAALL